VPGAFAGGVDREPVALFEPMQMRMPVQRKLVIGPQLPLEIQRILDHHYGPFVIRRFCSQFKVCLDFF
jgi:hypothetical protein